MYVQLHRTQILLEPWQHEALQQMSAEQGKSMSALIREFLGDALRNPASTKEALMALAGCAPGAYPYDSHEDFDRDLADTLAKGLEWKD